MTAAFGKWHLTPGRSAGIGGPFDRWPNGLGFDYFWGFLGGEAGQYDPLITENQKTIGRARGQGRRAFYFPDAMTDKTIEWLHGVRAQKPGQAVVRLLLDRLQPRARTTSRRSGRDKYKGKFDEGWDVLREQTLERQKQLGVIPPDAELTPRTRRSRRGTR